METQFAPSEVLQSSGKPKIFFYKNKRGRATNIKSCYEGKVRQLVRCVLTGDKSLNAKRFKLPRRNPEVESLYQQLIKSEKPFTRDPVDWFGVPYYKEPKNDKYEIIFSKDPIELRRRPLGAPKEIVEEFQFMTQLKDMYDLAQELRKELLKFSEIPFRNQCYDRMTQIYYKMDARTFLYTAKRWRKIEFQLHRITTTPDKRIDPERRYNQFVGVTDNKKSTVKGLGPYSVKYILYDKFCHLIDQLKYVDRWFNLYKIPGLLTRENQWQALDDFIVDNCFSLSRDWISDFLNNVTNRKVRQHALYVRELRERMETLEEKGPKNLFKCGLIRPRSSPLPKYYGTPLLQDFQIHQDVFPLPDGARYTLLGYDLNFSEQPLPHKRWLSILGYNDYLERCNRFLNIEPKPTDSGYGVDNITRIYEVEKII